MVVHNASRGLLALPTHLRALAFQQCLAAAKARQPISRPLRSYATYNTNASGTSPPDHANTATSSVNATEVSHFNTLASSWWDPHGSSRLLHLMNPLRHQFIRKCLFNDLDSAGTEKEKRKFLDIGCGGGIFAESAARLAMTESVVGIDPTPECIRVAKGHARQDPLLLQPGKLTYHNIAIEDLPLPSPARDNGSGGDPRFDIITLFEVIEHIRQPGPFLTNVLAHLKPGGWLVGSTIARTGTSWFTTKFVAEEVLRMVPRGTHEWSQYINPSEMREWARSRPELDVQVGSSGWQQMGVVYVPGMGWKVVGGSEDWGNYFFGVRKAAAVREEE